MNMYRICVFFLFAGATFFTEGCALLSKGDQGAARFFSIAQSPVQSDSLSAKNAVPTGSPIFLRLGRVSGAVYLEERLVYRNSAEEVGYYRERRWTAPPEEFLSQRLSRVLFEERGLVRVVGGAGPTLDVRLTTLDEILYPKHTAKVEIVARLQDYRLVRFEKTMTVELPIVVQRGEDPATATVSALSAALQKVINEIADNVVRSLEEPMPQ